MKKIVVFFILSFSLTLLIMLSMHKVRESNRKNLLSTQAQVIGKNIEEKFIDYFNHIAYSAIQIAKVKRHLASNKVELHMLYDDFLKQNPSVLGVNSINEKGIINEVYPYDPNKNALNRKTQAHGELKKLTKDQKLWLSVPFNLFQGMTGFAFYIRTHIENSAWTTVVITSESFFKEFIYDELKDNFHIQFRESVSKSDYLRTADISPLVPRSTIQERSFQFYNRDFDVVIWPKKSNFTTTYPWLWPTFLSLVLALISSLAYWWWSQNTESKTRLEELNHLLRLTIHDTSNSLTAIKGYLEMMKDDPEIVPVERLSKHVSFIIDLLDQIKVMKQLSTNNQEWKKTENSLLQIILEVSDILSDRLKVKKLSLNYNPELLVDVKLDVNKGLFSHSVIGNLLSNAIKFSYDNNTISIDYHQEDKYHVIEISDQGEGMSQSDLQKIRKGSIPNSKSGTRGEAGTGFGLMIVQQVMTLHGGRVEFTNIPTGGTVARVFLPFV